MSSTCLWTATPGELHAQLGLELEGLVCGSPTLGGQICVDPCCADVPRRRMEPGAWRRPAVLHARALPQFLLALLWNGSDGVLEGSYWMQGLCHITAVTERRAVQPMRCQS